ncbi:L-ascorbate metabolism protein UlaG (beta-lactamase superfamily) [Mycolicibacterium sp. BK556]|uniref:MBL fold metallo-hydrolase n=1 Tax=unclassified Mycolicibacterium TaxID=2636767 RepID=UPI00160FB0A9|nr:MULTISPECIES: MBL fold metallo-hydrolase [unclassified Mycolicibacterium]MBB3601574.1 L-ascorbate metabolism protein UlaG (beta-lactamase superfamily) [Mycolicibacterium sp. BK556]MBB3631326.1 L-ascorbate metabolism protein UlaG (beta-lactamase superfamily) [Mycolicibacterium sp. BK607]
MSNILLTHLGGPTTLIELDGWRILTDPTFDAPGRRYTFGWGTSSVKVAGPAQPPEVVGPVDVVVLSHDQHADNLDDAGRALLGQAGTVITTVPAARRLSAPNVRGLADWESTTLDAPGRTPLTVTATPGRHGPKFSRPIAGKVNGFALHRNREDTAALWMSGDTVLYDGLREVAKRIPVDVALLHLGGVRFGFTGPVRFTMTARDGAELIRLMRPRVTVPVHYEGWTHFRDAESDARQTLSASNIRWLAPGERTEL